MLCMYPVMLIQVYIHLSEYMHVGLNFLVGVWSRCAPARVFHSSRNFAWAPLASG
jgi:hypothetical protein